MCVLTLSTCSLCVFSQAARVARGGATREACASRSRAQKNCTASFLFSQPPAPILTGPRPSSKPSVKRYMVTCKFCDTRGGDRRDDNTRGVGAARRPTRGRCGDQERERDRESVLTPVQRKAGRAGRRALARAAFTLRFCSRGQGGGGERRANPRARIQHSVCAHKTKARKRRRGRKEVEGWGSGGGDIKDVVNERGER